MELQITVTLSERLFGLLEEKLPNLGNSDKTKPANRAGETSPSAEVENNCQKPVSPLSDTADSTAPDEQAAAISDDDNRDSVSEPQNPTQPQMPKELTEADVRAAIHRTRQRFEGENYKDNTESEEYKKHHRNLTSQFLQIAALLGADKPSALPPEKRQAFIDQCQYLTIGEDGSITMPSPF